MFFLKIKWKKKKHNKFLIFIFLFFLLVLGKESPKNLKGCSFRMPFLNMVNLFRLLKSCLPLKNDFSFSLMTNREELWVTVVHISF